MASYGFNFRASDTYVTDPSDCTYVIETDVYPTTRSINGQSVTFGLVSGYSGRSRDRDSGLDARLAGEFFCDDATDMVFRVDLPTTGTKNIRLAGGGATAGREVHLQILDNVTQRLLVEDASVAAASFLDASAVERTAANWPAANVAASLTFASTALFLHVTENGNSGHVSAIAHMFIEDVGGSTQAPRSSSLTMQLRNNN